MEEGKDPAATTTVISRSNQSRALPQRLIQLLALFLVLCFTISLFSVYMIRKTGVVTTVTSAIPILQPCIQQQSNNNLDHWITPPSNLIHTMSDEELFWRASFVPQVKQYPFSRVPKIAFMFLTKGPLPLAPLWERFFKGHESLFSIYIHSLPSYEPRFPSTSVFFNRQIPSQVAEWGRMSMCDAERRLLANALLDISNEYFILVSESCIPIYNFTTIYRYTAQSKYSFIGAFDDPGPFGRGRPACYVDEHYFPTLLTIRAPNLLANRSLTWVDWSRGGAHPATFGATDITEGFMMKLMKVKNVCIMANHLSYVICLLGSLLRVLYSNCWFLQLIFWGTNLI
ncbi:hypothetical protein R6Q59_004399 [Mikania micrantha]